VAFWQEIYNEHGKLVEVHHKFPEDLGHTGSGPDQMEDQ
jgi:hypothetical protein